MSASGRTLAFLKMARHSVIRPRIVPHAMVVLFLVLSILIPNGNFSTCAFQSTSIPCTTRNNAHAPLRVNRINPLLLATSVNPTDRTDDVSQVVSDDNDDTVMIGTVQILMSDTGGGHRASAIALQDAFNTLYSTTTTNTKIECDIVDIYTDYGPVWPYNDYVSIYKYMAAHPWMWKLLYEFGQSDFGLWFNQFMLEWWCSEAFTKCLARIPPPTTADRTTTMTRRRADLIISVHPLTQDLPLKIVSKLDHLDGSSTRTTPFVTVVTDLGSAHPTWFHPGVDKCFVPSDALYKAALQRQLQPHQIVQYGLPIRKGFWSQQPTLSGNDRDDSKIEQQQQIRQQLGLNDTIPIVLVVGGGDGMGGIIDISKELGYELSRSSDLQSQMVVICGKNQFAKEQLEQVTNWGSNVKVHIKGFVNNMDEYMKASDVLVTKAGPGTIAEASICGLPCMMFSYLPGQEEGNIPYVVDAGFGTYSSDPTVIGNTVREWLSHPESLRRMQQAAYTASRPNATLDIARDIGAMLFEHLKRRAE